MGRTKKSLTTSSSASSHSSDSNAANRPRNHFITDATQPYTFSFVRFGSPTSIIVHQTPDEATWPGGALWDLGVLLAQVLVKLTRGASLPSHHHLSNINNETPQRLLDAVPDYFNWKDIRVLELGCGVGLTGLVAASLGARLTVLTDLDIVVERVVQPNVECNTSVGPNKSCGYRVMKAGGGRVAAIPLCWGDASDEVAAAAALERLTPKKPMATGKRTLPSHASSQDAGIPNLILIGDVAYQHKPGAPSHFEALVSTLLKFMNDDTLVLFGTRMRMPASADLLDMFHQSMDELVIPPLEAHELDSSFHTNELLGRKHNMTIHLLRKKKQISVES